MVAVGGVGIGLRKAWTWDGVGVISRVNVGLLRGGHVNYLAQIVSQ